MVRSRPGRQLLGKHESQLGQKARPRVLIHLRAEGTIDSREKFSLGAQSRAARRTTLKVPCKLCIQFAIAYRRSPQRILVFVADHFLAGRFLADRFLADHRNFSASCFRAECRRDFTVPTGTCSSSATSSRERPSILVSNKTSRDFSDSAGIASCKRRSNSFDAAISSAVGLGRSITHAVSRCWRRCAERA